MILGESDPVKQWEYWQNRAGELELAIREHRSQRADDKCWMDDDKLYAVLGDGIKSDRRVGDKEAMLANCKRYIDLRCSAGGWPTYVELEAEIARLKATQQAVHDMLVGYNCDRQAEVLSIIEKPRDGG